VYTFYLGYDLNEINGTFMYDEASGDLMYTDDATGEVYYYALEYNPDLATSGSSGAAGYTGEYDSANYTYDAATGTLYYTDPVTGMVYEMYVGYDPNYMSGGNGSASGSTGGSYEFSMVGSDGTTYTADLDSGNFTYDPSTGELVYTDPATTEMYRYYVGYDESMFVPSSSGSA
jgi:hypothetical protein